MAYLTTVPGVNDGGYDPVRNRVTLSLSKTVTLYLVAGSGLDVRNTNPDQVSCTNADPQPWERKNAKVLPWDSSAPLKRLDLTARAAGGTTTIRFLLGGRDELDPLTVQVVANLDGRELDGGAQPISAAFRAEVDRLTLRDTVIRVAEDQMNSIIGRTANAGFGRYCTDKDKNGKDVNWCGAFAFWCWKQAARLKGVRNPLGTNYDVLLSPQKAISWALRPDTPGAVLRYKGGDPFGRSPAMTRARPVAEYPDGLQRGDICLYRDDTDWRHVCLLDDTLGSDIGEFVTMDGNQGSPCIKRNRRDAGKRLKNGDHAYAFVGVNV